jgi:hypothetical protein
MNKEILSEQKYTSWAGRTVTFEYDWPKGAQD